MLRNILWSMLIYQPHPWLLAVGDGRPVMLFLARVAGSNRNHWPDDPGMRTLREKLVKIGAKVVSHGRYVTFQLAEVAVPRELFRKILSLIDDLRPRPAPA